MLKNLSEIGVYLLTFADNSLCYCSFTPQRTSDNNNWLVQFQPLYLFRLRVGKDLPLTPRVKRTKSPLRSSESTPSMEKNSPLESFAKAFYLTINNMTISTNNPSSLTKNPVPPPLHLPSLLKTLTVTTAGTSFFGKTRNVRFERKQGCNILILSHITLPKLW